jgi:hypothetical protein
MRKSNFLCFEVEDLEHLLKLPPPPSSEGGQTKPTFQSATAEKASKLEIRSRWL